MRCRRVELAVLGELVLVHARRGTGPVGGKVVLAVEELHGLPHVVVVEASGFESEFVPGHRVFVVVYGSHTELALDLIHVERGSVGELEFVVEETGAARVEVVVVAGDLHHVPVLVRQLVPVYHDLAVVLALNADLA